MSRYAWILALSLVGGSLLAMLLGGGGSPSFFVIAGVVIVGGCLWLRAAVMRPRSRRESAGFPAVALREPQLGDNDRRVLDGLHRLAPRPIAWIESLEFEGAWRDEGLAPLREFERLERERVRLSDPELDLLLEELGASVRAFLDLYDRITSPDPMLRDRSWRILDVDPRSGSDAGDADADAARQLRTARDAIVSAYDRVRMLVEYRERQRSGRSRR